MIFWKAFTPGGTTGRPWERPNALVLRSPFAPLVLVNRDKGAVAEHVVQGSSAEDGNHLLHDTAGCPPRKRPDWLFPSRSMRVDPAKGHRCAPSVRTASRTDGCLPGRYTNPSFG